MPSGFDCFSDQRPWHALHPWEVRRLIWEGATIVQQARRPQAVGWAHGKARVHPESEAQAIASLLPDRDTILLCLCPARQDPRPLARTLTAQGYRYVFTLRVAPEARSPRP